MMPAGLEVAWVTAEPVRMACPTCGRDWPVAARTTPADKVLYISLLDPGLFGGQPTPVASSSQWAANAGAGVRQTVSNLLVQADPAWAQMIAAGWQPSDVRMTEEDVSGLVEVHQAGGAASHRFRLQVIVGSSRWRGGYGTVAVSGWQEQ